MSHYQTIDPPAPALTRGNVMDFETTERSGRYCGDEDGGNPQCGR